MSSWSDRRVVVTGIGCVSSLGSDPDTLWKNILAGQCGIDRVAAFDISAYDCQIAAEVRGFDPTPAFPGPKEVRRTDRFTHFGVYAGWGALKDSGLDLEKVDRDEVGVFLGSGIGGLHTTEEQHKILLAKGPGRVSPFMIPMLILNMASGLFSLYHRLRGPNFATCSACATATHALGEAWATIKRGDASVMFAGGTEATVVPLGMSGFAAMKAMSTRNAEPKRASRPFDRDRDGFVMGEGAAVLVLEELEHAKKRGARIYCEVMGYGNTADANHMTAPDPEGEGAGRAMKMALRHAGLRPDQVDYINCHATSTPVGDLCEVKMIKRVFGDHAYKLAASGTKGATGHMLGAAGAIEMAICCKAVEAQVAPPTINLDNPDPEADLDLVAHTPQERKIDVFANNSFGFGGHNAIIVGRRFVG
ncbi:MAG: beta-ketoacyl-ACP synthase II [Verrucomicrobiota bacterium]